jgi:hypothetical protein
MVKNILEQSVSSETDSRSNGQEIPPPSVESENLL